MANVEVLPPGLRSQPAVFLCVHRRPGWTESRRRQVPDIPPAADFRIRGRMWWILGRYFCEPDVRFCSCYVDGPGGPCRGDDSGDRPAVPRKQRGDQHPWAQPGQQVHHEHPQGAPLRPPDEQRRAAPGGDRPAAERPRRAGARRGSDRHRPPEPEIQGRRQRRHAGGVPPQRTGRRCRQARRRRPHQHRRRPLRLRPHRPPAGPPPDREGRRRPRPAPARHRGPPRLGQRPRQARQPAAPRLGPRPVRGHHHRRRGEQHHHRQRRPDPGHLLGQPGHGRLHRVRHQGRPGGRQHRPLARRRGPVPAPAEQGRRPGPAHRTGQGRAEEHRARHQPRHHHRLGHRSSPRRPAPPTPSPRC